MIIMIIMIIIYRNKKKPNKSNKVMDSKVKINNKKL